MNTLENISRNITMKFWYCLSGGICIKKDVPLVEFIYLVFTCMPDENANFERISNAN